MYITEIIKLIAVLVSDLARSGREWCSGAGERCKDRS